MKLDYIYHSGFAIEADGITVIIDYYKDSSEEAPDRGIVHDHLLKKPGTLYAQRDGIVKGQFCEGLHKNKCKRNKRQK